jgi:hypothetical protein
VGDGPTADTPVRAAGVLRRLWWTGWVIGGGVGYVMAFAVMQQMIERPPWGYGLGALLTLGAWAMAAWVWWRVRP